MFETISHFASYVQTYLPSIYKGHHVNRGIQDILINIKD